jgi:hypothetical protein
MGSTSTKIMARHHSSSDKRRMSSRRARLLPFVTGSNSSKADDCLDASRPGSSTAVLLLHRSELRVIRSE